MKRSKLIEILGVFTEEEMHRLGLFLHSSYFTQSFRLQEKSVDLYHSLYQRFPDFEPEAVEKAIIYEEIYPGELYKAGRLEKVMSSLSKQIELFIQVEQEFGKDRTFKSMLSLSNFFRDRGLHRLHGISVNHLEKHQADLKIKTREDLYHDYLLQQAISNYRAIYNQRNNDLHLPATLMALDTYFLASRLELSSDLMAQKRFHNIIETKDCFEVLTLLQPYLEAEQFAQIPLIKVYAVVYHIFNTSQLDAEAILQSIKKLEHLLTKFKEALPAPHIRSLHSFSRSLLMSLLNLGRKDLNRYAFDLYREHLESKVLYNNNGIHAASFKNIVSVGLMQQEYDWVKRFLEQHREEISGTDFPEEVYQFNLANYYFHTKAFDLALQTLGQNYNDLYYTLAAKRLEIKLLYEEESDLLEYKLNAFKLFIHRLSKNKLPEIPRTGNKNFINALKQIISPTNNSSIRRQRITDKLSGTANVKDKDWLLAICQAGI